MVSTNIYRFNPSLIFIDKISLYAVSDEKYVLFVNLEAKLYKYNLIVFNRSSSDMKYLLLHGVIISFFLIILSHYAILSHAALSAIGINDRKEHTVRSQNLTNFIYLTKTGGMRGSGSALSDTVYIGRNGSVQVSREETSGVLHSIRTVVTDTASFFTEFESFISSMERKHKSGSIETDGMVSEYYPPQITLCYAVNGEESSCFTETESRLSVHVRKIMDMVDRKIQQAELLPGPAGLYIRSQQMPESFIEYVKPDIRLIRVDDVSDEKARSSVLEMMSFVYAGRTAEKIMISENVSLIPGRPVYLLTGDNHLYLLTAYSYRK